MKKLALMFALVVPMAACDGGAAGAILKKMKDGRAKICACKDAACVVKVKDELKAWMEKNESKFNDFKPSKGQMEILGKIEMETATCEGKLKKQAEQTPPAAPVPTPAPAAPAAGSAAPAAPAAGSAAPADPAAAAGSAAAPPAPAAPQ